MYDVLIAGGTVVDGSGSPGTRADVGVERGRIVAIGNLGGDGAVRRVDADGRIVAPGFIDSHCHSELSLVARPTADSKVRQGVTTEILGNCGWSAFPLADTTRDTIIHFSRPIFGHPAVDWTWTDLTGYFGHLEGQAVGVNVATLVGHGNLRAAVLDFEDRAPSASELEQMKALAQQAMDQGALGISTGLCYPPGVYATTDELTEIARVVGSAGGVYATHMRDQVDRLLESVQESLTVARGAGLPLLVSHHKTVGKRNYGKVKQSLRMLDEARATGLDAFSDTYPYIAGSSTIVTMLPPWVISGGLDAMLSRLADTSIRARIARDWEAGLPGWENRVAAVGWENVSISYVATDRNRDLEGLTVVEAAARREKPILDFFCDLLLEERGEVGQVMVNSREEDLVTVLTDPHTMVGSDGLDVGERPHPRQYGTFPKVLGEFVREKGALSLESAVHKMTGLPARVFRLPEVGLLRDGYRADIVIFDPARIADTATYVEPRRYPEGIDWVMVGGVAAVAEGRVTGDLNGRIVRRSN